MALCSLLVWFQCNGSKIHSTLNTGNRFWFTNMFVFLIIFTSTTVPHLWPWQDDYHKQCIAASISNLGDLRNWWKIWERTSGISERFLCSFADPSVCQCCQCVEGYGLKSVPKVPETLQLLLYSNAGKTQDWLITALAIGAIVHYASFYREYHQLHERMQIHR